MNPGSCVFFSNTESCTHKIRIIMRKYLSIKNDIIEIMSFLMFCFACEEDAYWIKRKILCTISKKTQVKFFCLHYDTSFHERKLLQVKIHVVLFHWSFFTLAKLLVFLRFMCRYPKKTPAQNCWNARLVENLQFMKTLLFTLGARARFVHMNTRVSGWLIWSFYLEISMKCKQVELFHIQSSLGFIASVVWNVTD